MPEPLTKTKQGFASTPNIDILYDIEGTDFDREIKAHQKFESLIERWKKKALSGDPNAFDALHRGAFMIISAMLKVEEAQKAVVENVASKRLTWPVLLTSSVKQNAATVKSVNSLKIGSQAGRSYDLDKVSKSDIDSKKIAFHLAKIIEGLRESEEVQNEIERLEAAIQVKTTPAKKSQLKALSSNRKGSLKVREAVHRLSIDFGTKVSWNEYDDARFSTRALRLPALTRDTVKEWRNFAYAIFTHLNGNAPELIPKIKKIKAGEQNDNGENRGLLRTDLRDAILEAFVNQARFSDDP